MVSTPTNQKLYTQVKKEADKKFDEKTSVYKSMWIVNQYKKRGGKYKGKKSINKGITRWLKEEWIDVKTIKRDKTGKIVKYEKCGRDVDEVRKTGYPLCRPFKRITKETPKTVKELSKKSLKKAKNKKKSTKRIKF